MAVVTGAPQVGAVQQTPDVGPNGGNNMVPFRSATVERVNILPSESQLLTAVAQRIERNVEGAGFLYGILLDLQGTASANTVGTNVAFAEDGPWNALAAVVLKDVNGETVNLGGFETYVENVIAWQGKGLDWTSSSHWSTQVGNGSSAGNFHIAYRVPAGINRRDLVGILGNQDRAQKFSLRTDINGSGQLFATAPATTQPTIGVKKYYENYTVPLPQGPTGQQQQVLPDFYGTLHFATIMTSETVPQGGSTTTHFLRRIGNTVRAIVPILRSGSGATPRATANANMPSSITFKAGDDTLFFEDTDYRQWINFERYGIEVDGGPGLFNGVLCYENLHDFTGYIAAELGDDYYHTNALVNAQFQFAMPSGFGTTSNSLNFLTDDMIFAAPVGA